eukprot:1632124-Pleurochrysis_carterae.AAC.4
MPFEELLNATWHEHEDAGDAYPASEECTLQDSRCGAKGELLGTIAAAAWTRATDAMAAIVAFIVGSRGAPDT